MRRTPILVALISVMASALVAAGCGNGEKTVSGTNSSGQVTTRTVPDVKFAKTKFVLHSGLAFGAFHRYLYKPYRAGTFKKGADGRTKALVKGALAAAFTANELKNARNAALSDDKLRGLGDILNGLIARTQGLVPGLKNGNVDTGSLVKIATGIGGVTALANQFGIKVPDLPTPALGG